RGLVGARPREADGREVGRGPHDPEVRRRVPPGPVDEAERVPRAQLLPGRLHPGCRRDRAPPRDRRRQPAVGQRPAASRGHLPAHPALDHRAVRRRARGRGPPHPGRDRSRPLRDRARRAGADRGAHRADGGRGPHPDHGAAARMSLAESPRVLGPMPLGFPMPRDLALIDPATPRVRVRTVTDRFPFPIPNGWFAVARSADLAPGSVVPAHYFGRDLALFRTEAGEARVVDAYCPHLGAHLAVGGSVQGDTVACPFHGWRFDGASGACVEIPYASSERVPGRAAVRAYPVVETNGLVFAWHHATGGDPFYDVPEVPELADPGWLDPHLIEFRIATSCQEMAENNHDHAHFKYVHGTDAVPAATE